MERIRSFDPSRNFEGWLFAMAHNLAIDYLRRYRPESIDEPLPSGDSRAELIPALALALWIKCWPANEPRSWREP